MTLTGQIELGKSKKYYVYKNLLIDCESDEVLINFKEAQEQFNKVYSYASGIPHPITDKMFEDWAKNKAWFLERTGGQMIYTYPHKIYLQMSDAEKIEAAQSVIEYIYDTVDTGEESALAAFLDHFRSVFFSKFTDEEYIDGDIKVPKGMKIIKAIKYFIEDEELRSKVQDFASAVLQRDKMEGTLCISIHPLDFLSTSENNYNWRSCHALDGEFKSGNLSYMTDASTVVVYMRGDNKVKLPRFPESVPWNSKKWRMLLHFENHYMGVACGRQYPFYTADIFALLSEILKDVFQMTCEQWLDNTIRSYQGKEVIGGQSIPHSLGEDYFPIGYQMYRVKDLFEDAESSLQYDDLLKSTVYKRIIAVNSNRATNPKYNPFRIQKIEYKWTIGHSVVCPRCGEKLIRHSEFLQCDKCECLYGGEEADNSGLFTYCYSCGERHLYEDTVDVGYDRYVCARCADKYTTDCAKCGTKYLTDELKFDLQDWEGKPLCGWCQDDIMREKMRKKKELEAEGVTPIHFSGKIEGIKVYIDGNLITSGSLEGELEEDN